MQLLDHYLQAVNSWLPKEQRADIVAELRDDLRSEIEEKGRALGRLLSEDPADPEGAARGRLRTSAIAELVADLLVLSWWLDVHPAAMPELGIVLTPVWSGLYWPVAALLAASAVVALANALRPSWSRPRLIARLSVDGFAVVLLGILLGAGPWVDVTASRLPAATIAGIEKWMNLTWLVTLLVIAFTYGARVLQHARRLTGREPIHHRAMSLLTGD